MTKRRLCQECTRKSITVTDHAFLPEKTDLCQSHEGTEPTYAMRGSAAAAAKSLQSCPTLCDPIDGSPPGSPVPGILQARTLLEWVAISFPKAWKWEVKVKSLSRVRLFATPWTAAYQAPPPMGFSRQEYQSGVPLPSPEGGVGRSPQKTAVSSPATVTLTAGPSLLPGGIQSHNPRGLDVAPPLRSGPAP